MIVSLLALLALVAAASIAFAVRMRARSLRADTAAENARRAAADAQERRFNILEAVADGIYIVDEELVVTHVNEEAERLLGGTADALIGQRLDRVVDPLASELVPDITLARRDGAVVEQTYVFPAAERWVEIRIKPAATETLVHLRDVTARTRADTRLRESEQRLQLVTQNVDAVLWTAGRDARFSAVAGGALDDLGLDAQELIDESCDRLLARSFLDEAFAGNAVRTESALGERWLRHHVEPLRDLRRGDVQGAVGVSIDITELKRAEQRLFDSAHHDRLTGLPNRLALEQTLADAIAGANRNDRRFAVLFVDLDRFKTINDTLGHDVGDEVLRRIADRLKEAVRTGDVVARPGGDEFIILLPRIAGTGDIDIVAQRLVRLVGQAVDVAGTELFLGASVGVAIYPDHGRDARTLVSHADAAMYRAKRAGGNVHAYFEESMKREASERLAMETDLRHALDRGEFHVLYQPIVDVGSERVTGCEALVRWRHPIRGLVMPDSFIPLAEETGTIIELDRWVLAQACEMAAAMRVHAPDFHMSVNASTRDLRERDLPDAIAAVLGECGLDPSALTIEVTEHVVLDGTVLPVIERIAALGVQVAIDDFGVGNSCLSYLKRLPITALKIDRSFISNLAEDKQDQAIVRSIVAVANALELRITAEGLETDAQVAFIASLGCEQGQGYRFAVPLPREQLEAMLVGQAPALPAGG